MSALLTVQEAAEYARCEHRTIRRAIKDGSLPASYGSCWLVLEDDLLAWLRARAERRLNNPSPQTRRNHPRPHPGTSDRAGSVARLKAIGS